MQRVRAMVAAGGAVALLMSGACAPKVDTAAEAQKLSALDDEWSKAAATKDAAKVAAFYAEDAIAYPPEEPVAVGRAAAQKVWAGYFADSTYQLSWKTDHSGVAASGELGFTSGSFADSYKGPDGKVVAKTGKYLCIWRKEKDGTWKAIHDTWNYDSK